MKMTGERYIPGMTGAIEVEHLHRYGLARGLIAGLDVLDVASGEGYGSRLLSETARSVTGVDVAREAVAFARRRYGRRRNLSFKVGSCAAIPIADASMDAVISFETIEHHDQHAAMMAECARVLRPDGFLLISSPNKAVYSDAAVYANPYHVKELYLEEFDELIRTVFPHVQLYGQSVVSGSLLRPLKVGDSLSASVMSGGGHRLTPLAEAEFQATYFVALCARAATALPSLASSLFLHAVLARAAAVADPPAPGFECPPQVEAQGILEALAARGVTELSEGAMLGSIEHPLAGGSDWTGWALESSRLTPADAILLGDNRTTLLLRPQFARPDVADHVRALSAWMAGCRISAELMAALELSELRAAALSGSGLASWLGVI